MVKAQKIIERKALTLGVVLSIGFFGSIVQAGPKQSSGLSDFGGVEGGYRRAIKAATDNTAAVTRAEEVKKELAQNPGNTAAAQELQQINRGVDQRSQQTYGDADRFKDDREMQQLATNVANTAKDWPHMQAYADRWASLAKPDSPEWAKAVNTGGFAALKTGDFKKSEASALRVLEKFPKDKDALFLYNASKGRTKAGPAPTPPPPGPTPPSPAPAPNASNGLKEYADRVARARNLNSLATSRLMMRDGNEAKRLALEAQALEPGIGRSYLLEARAWGILGDLAQALDRMGRAIELLTKEGGNPLADAYTDRAKIQNALKNRGAAVKDADAALQINPNLAQAHRQRGAALQALGEIEAAKAALRRAAELDGGGSDGGDYYGQSEQAAKEGPPQVARPAKSVLHKAWTKLLDKTGGSFTLFMGAMGAASFLIAGGVLWFAKEGSAAGRFKTRWFTPSGGARTAGRDGQDDVIGIEGLAFEHSRYLAGRQIDAGGMGAIHEGRDTKLNRSVAIKRMNAELRLSPEHRRRFLKEGETVARLKHPNIVDIYSFCDEHAQLVIIFEFISGKNLHVLLRESPGGRMDSKLVVAVLRQIASAIDYAHRQDVIHRDMKPANVMIDEHGNVKVMDFGIARQLEHQRTTLTNTSVGTPLYMAPEQADGIVTKQSDVYSVGVMAYELLTGELPFRGEGAQLEKREGRFAAATEIMPILPAAVDPIFSKVLAANYNLRYAPCMEFVEALDAALSPPLA